MSHTYYLPQIHGNATVTTQGDLSPNAQLFAQAWMQLLGKRAAIMVMSDTLNRCAFLHATYLDSRTEAEIAERAHIANAMHYGRDWSTANERVRLAGYLLSDNYPIQGNNVESCSRSSKDPATVLAELAAHEAHREHMLGTGGFVWQVVWGCACVGNDYVALTAMPEATA
jgi:hypothetical protein